MEKDSSKSPAKRRVSWSEPDEEPATPVLAKRCIGRPPNKVAVPDEEPVVPKRRGRPPKHAKLVASDPATAALPMAPETLGSPPAESASPETSDDPEALPSAPAASANRRVEIINETASMMTQLMEIMPRAITALRDNVALIINCQHIIPARMAHYFPQQPAAKLVTSHRTSSKLPFTAATEPSATAANEESAAAAAATELPAAANEEPAAAVTATAAATELPAAVTVTAAATELPAAVIELPAAVTVTVTANEEPADVMVTVTTTEEPAAADTAGTAQGGSSMSIDDVKAKYTELERMMNEMSRMLASLLAEKEVSGAVVKKA